MRPQRTVGNQGRIPGAALVCILALLPLIAGAAPVSDGAPAPDFQLKDMEGKAVRLSGLRGHPVVLHFWASWCSHCLEEMPMLEKLQSELKGRGVTVLAINLGEPKRKVARYVEERRLRLSILLDGRGKVAKAYGVVGLPATVVVDSGGKVAGRIEMGSLSRQGIEEALATP